MRNDDGLEKSINLDRVSHWETVTQDEVCVVLIPKEKHEDEKCVAAKLVGLNKLKKSDTYEEAPDEGQFRISTTWVLWNKGDEVRARLVARGYEGKDPQTVGKSSMRIVLAIAVNKGWKIKTTDVKSAFVQGKELGREVYLSPPKKIKREGFIWRLKRGLYGLNDAARQFYQTVTECLINLGCIQSKLDPALFYRINSKGNLTGLLACHVDDFLHAGTEEFERHVMKNLYNRFLIGRVEVSDFKYIGFHVIQNSDSIMLDQAEYIDNIENGIINPSRARCKTDSLTDKEQTLLRQLVGQLNWSVQGSRPDLSFDMIELSTKLKHGLVGDLMKAIKCTERIKSEKFIVKFNYVGDHKDWQLLVVTDAALGNLEGSGSTGGKLILLSNSKGDLCPLSWYTNKIKRVVRSTLAAEMLSLQEGIDEAIYLRSLICELINVPQISIPIIPYVDNKSVTEALFSTKLVDDKRWRIDVVSVKDSIDKHEINAARWIQGENQLANPLTKKGASAYLLKEVISTGKLNI